MIAVAIVSTDNSHNHADSQFVLTTGVVIINVESSVMGLKPASIDINAAETRDHATAKNWSTFVIRGR